MQIQRGDYFLNSDSQCYWITKGADKDPRHRQRVTGYFRRPQDCYRDFVEKKLSGSEAKSMEELLEDVAKIREDLMELVREEE